MPRVRPEDVISTARDAVLVIDHTDQWPRSMTVISDGMAVDRRPQPLPAGLRQRGRQRRVTGCSGSGKLNDEILKPVGGSETRLQSRRSVRFPRKKNIGVVLRIGAKPEVHDAEVAVGHVTARDHWRLRIGLRRSKLPAPYRDGRVEPEAQPHLCDALTHPPTYVGVRGDAGHND